MPVKKNTEAPPVLNNEQLSDALRAVEAKLNALIDVLPAPRPKPETVQPNPSMADLLQKNKEAGAAVDSQEVAKAMGNIMAMAKKIPDTFDIN